MAAEKNILLTIADAARERVEEERARVPLFELRARTRDLEPIERPFERALRAPGMSFICEVKRASPSRGAIAEGTDPVAVARAYEEAGAAAVSCLTEPRWFKGSLDDLRAVSAAVRIPVLRKDFVVDEYMVWQARVAGAAAVLLICGILTDEQLAEYVVLAHELGMSALVEAYEPEELPRALATGARVVGVNNRDLRTFEVDFGRSARLRPLVGEGRVFVSESGVRTRADVALLEEAGVDAVLVGETLMRAPDTRAALAELRGVGEAPTPRTRVKLCGLSRAQDVEDALAARPDLVGFVVEFERSRRSVTGGRLAELSRALDGSGIERVGVFVDADPARVAELARAAGLEWVQLHGSEGEAYVARLREALLAAGSAARVIQAFCPRSAADVARAERSPADLVLLDSGKGTGRVFDWSYARAVCRPYLLAGGLGPGNVAQAVRELHPWGVDMSSGIETDGSKDPEKMRAAVAAVRGAGT